MQEEQQKNTRWILKIILPIVILILGFISASFWFQPSIDFINEHKWQLLLFYVATMIYISWMFYNWFQFHNENLRRSWYFLFIVGVALLLADKGFSDNQWSRFVLLVSMFIFVDLAIFLTPIISKIAGAEFSQKAQSILKTNKNMEVTIEKINSKSKTFTTFISRMNHELIGTMRWSTIEEYKESLQQCLKPYSDSCHQRIHLYSYFDNDSLKNELGNTSNIQLSIPELEELNQGNYIQKEEKVMVPFSIFPEYPLVILVEAKTDVVHTIDIANILNIATIHSWYRLEDTPVPQSIYDL